MALYETTYIVRQDISSSDVEDLTSGFSKVMEDNGSKIVKKEYWGLRKLAYPINKNKKGHYVHICTEGPAGGLAEVERKLRLNEDVLRFLTVKVDEINQEPSIVMNDNEEQQGEE